MAAGGTDVLYRHVPGHEIALAGFVLIGIILTAVVGKSPLGGLFENFTAALGTLARHLDHDGLGMVALGPAGTGQEPAKPSRLEHQVPSALGTDHIGHLVGHLDALGVLLGGLELLGKAAVEAGQDVPPVLLALFHLVQPFLHVGGKGGIHDVGEFLLHQAVDHLAQGGGTQVFPLFHHILPVQNGGDGGGIGGRTADPLLFQRLDEGGLGIAAGRLGEVLLGGGLVQTHHFPFLQVGQGRLGRFLVLVLALHIDRHIAGEFQGGVGGPEVIPGALHVDAHAVIHRRRHLAGQETAPDQFIEAVLLLGQVLAHLLGGQIHVGRPDGFVGVLGPRFGLIVPGFAGVVALAVAAQNKIPGGGGGLIGEAEGVGSHVGDETHGALTGDIHALIKLLGNGHGSPGGHVQLAAGLLLEGGGGKGRGRVALLLLPLHPPHRKGRLLDGIHHHLHFFGAVELHFLLPAMEGRLEPAHVGGDAVQLHIQRPVFLGHKGTDLLFPLGHQTGGHRLYPSGGESPADLLPQQRRELIAHDTVQNAPGLLGVHQILVDGPGGGNGLVDHLLGDLIKGHPVGLVVRNAQQFFQMPGNGLSFPVRVGGQIDPLALSRRLLEVLDDLLLALDGLIVRLEAVLHIHAQLALGQIADVAHGRLDFIARTQIFADGLGLGRRLHDHKIGFRH